jgi:hypothetical protein
MLPVKTPRQLLERGDIAAPDAPDQGLDLYLLTSHSLKGHDARCSFMGNGEVNNGRFCRLNEHAGGALRAATARGAPAAASAGMPVLPTGQGFAVGRSSPGDVDEGMFGACLRFLMRLGRHTDIVEDR